MKYTVHKGARDPYALRVVIDATNIAEADRVIADFTDVTAVDLRVADRRTGATATWATSIIAVTADVLTVEHPYEEPDTDGLRTWHVVPWQTVAGADNPVPVAGFDLQVVEP